MKQEWHDCFLIEPVSLIRQKIPKQLEIDTYNDVLD